MYDLYVPMVAEADRHYTFEEAKDIVKTGLAPMGEEYLGLLQEGFDNRWIDIYENEGKRSGAYSWGRLWLPSLCIIKFPWNFK